MQTSRRKLLQAGLGGAAAVAIGSRFASAASADVSGDNVLVVVQMSGGNDGLNTVIPFRSDAYRKARPVVAIRDKYYALSDELAFNPGMKAFKALFDQGKLAVINGCGYPQPSRSHFRSMEVWHTGEPMKEKAEGWLGNVCVRGSANPLKAVNVGSQLPQALVSERVMVPCVQSLADAGVGLGASGAGAAHPYGLRQKLRLVSQLIDAQAGTRVFYCQMSGFDTHANQIGQHENQLREMSESIAGFYKELSAKGRADQVTVMCFSEFGRSVAQNNSNGTDHGAAGPMFVVGGKVKGGLYGTYPSLTDLESGDLKYTTDFRRVYATVLDRWLGVDSVGVLGNRFEPMAFV